MHDTIGCYLDIDKGQIKFSKNGKFYSLFFFFLRTLFGWLKSMGKGVCMRDV